VTAFCIIISALAAFGALALKKLHSAWHKMETDILKKTNGVDIHAADLKEQFTRISHSGEDPKLVIAMAYCMFLGRSIYDASLGMTSAFYSQIRHAITRRDIVSALFYFNHARAWVRKAKSTLDETPKCQTSPIDYEVIGATAFMAFTKGRKLGVGYLFRDEALTYLYDARYAFMLADPEYQGLDPALVSAKLWRITGNDNYKMEVVRAGLTEDMDHNVLKRIAEHMGYNGIDPVGMMFEQLLCKPSP
jgi:hypothetical protein